MKIINPYRFGSGTDYSGLLTGLVSWWSMDETSGTRVDSHGSNDLTDNNTVGYTTGKVSNCASFVSANTEYLEKTATTVTRPFSFSFWCRVTSVTTTQFIFSGSSANIDIYIQSSAVNNRIIDTGLTNSCTGIANNTWFHYVCLCDSTSSPLVQKHYLNATEFDCTGTLGGEPIFLRWGARYNGLTPLNGELDEIGWWNRILTTEEISLLYNSGNGIGYPG